MPSTFLDKSIIEFQFDTLVAQTGIEAQNKAAEKAAKNARIKR